jgi:hypothetical protein
MVSFSKEQRKVIRKNFACVDKGELTPERRLTMSNRFAVVRASVLRDDYNTPEARQRLEENLKLIEGIFIIKPWPVAKLNYEAEQFMDEGLMKPIIADAMKKVRSYGSVEAHNNFIPISYFWFRFQVVKHLIPDFIKAECEKEECLPLCSGTCELQTYTMPQHLRRSGHMSEAKEIVPCPSRRWAECEPFVVFSSFWVSNWVLVVVERKGKKNSKIHLFSDWRW